MVVIKQHYCGLHNHTDYSNHDLLDSINKVDKLISYAKECGLSGIAITDHECLSAHLKAENFVKSKKKENPTEWENFRLILGNEIYLCRDGLNAKNFNKGVDAYHHFILLAKDFEGWQQLTRISARAWGRSYVSRMRRIPTYYQDLKEEIGNNPGHIIASTACLGGWLPKKILAYGANSEMKPQIQDEITDWLDMMVGLFGDDFYLEMQPSTTEEQIFVNQELIKISQAMGIKYIITTDAHYLNEEQRSIHELYLKADEGEREVASFYNSTFVMSAQKIHEYMDESIGAENVNIGLMNTLEIQAKCSEYTITSPIKIPYLPRKVYEKTPEVEANYKELINRIPTLKSFWESENLAERDFAIRLLEQYKKKFDDSKEKCERIEEELKILLESSRKNNMIWAAYLLQISDYINIYWTEGDSIVLPGRGSGVGFYLNYLLDIIQIDATREKAPLKPWRFLNPERASVLK